MVEKNEIKSSAHSKYRCQYHIVFAPKYRRKEIYGQLKKDIGDILRKLCEQKGVEIIEAEACVDHIHMLVSIPPHISIAQFMGYLKGKSTLMIFDRHANLKYKYGSRSFWCRGYYVDTVGKKEKKIKEYVQNQLREDIEFDQLRLKEYMVQVICQSEILLYKRFERARLSKRTCMILKERRFPSSSSLSKQMRYLTLGIWSRTSLSIASRLPSQKITSSSPWLIT